MVIWEVFCISYTNNGKVGKVGLFSRTPEQKLPLYHRNYIRMSQTLNIITVTF